MARGALVNGPRDLGAAGQKLPAKVISNILIFSRPSVVTLACYMFYLDFRIDILNDKMIQLEQKWRQESHLKLVFNNIFT